MRIAFLGTPDVAVPALQALLDADDIEVVVAVTNPDRPRGRRGTPQPPPVKVAAEQAGVEVWQPQRPSEIADDLRALDLDAGAVVAYGALLRTDVLTATRRGLVNLHFSLLPRWRGAAPVQHAIRARDQRTGVTTFVLDEGMDTGPVLDAEPVDIGAEETAGELFDRLTALGAPLLVRSLRRLVDEGVEPVAQPEDGATLAPKISPQDVALDFTRPADELAALVRSASPAPGAHTVFRDKRLKVLRARAEPGDGEPGTVLGADADGVLVATGDGALRLTEVQPEGKARMAGGAFANGHQPGAGERLGA